MIPIQLSRDEAVVFFDFLWRFASQNKLEIVDAAENRVLWDLLCELEAVLDEPFQANYAQILENSRDKVRGEE